MALQPNYPIVNLGELYANGAGLSVASNTTLGIGTGQLRDSTNINDIVIGTALVINSAVNGVNGLDSGTIANSTFYAVFVIGDSTQNNPTAGLISTSATAPVLPAGYDMMRRVGWALTDGAAHFLKGTQTGAKNSTLRKWWWDAPISVLGATAAAAFTAQSLAVAVPPIATVVTLQATLVANAASEFVALRPTGSSSTNGYAKLSAVAAGGASQIADMDVPCNATPSIDWITDAASTVALSVTAFLDPI